MMSSNGNIFHVTGPLWGESSGDRWIPLTKAAQRASNTEMFPFDDVIMILLAVPLKREDTPHKDQIIKGFPV